ncbi:ABC transporter permease [Cellulomonas cellasea]|uniref:ABC transporter permease n=1 Tax=Cellulomonas cellasea TaxID=43670 RepID=UPI0025A3EA25|nr:ABC transporter permease [Cellulomonas cellasea]MDM8083337.1 ABC transporter permease [Cellulomonas cellasea]
MFLALRELHYARSRFSLMGGVVALIAVLMVMLSGLSSGLVNDGVSGLKAQPADAFAFAEGTKTDSAFSRSIVDLSQVDAWADRPDVAAAAPLGSMLVNAHSSTDVPVDLALFGVQPGSFLEPAAAEGQGLGAPHGIVVSQTVLDDGLAIGDTVTIDRVGLELTIIGSTGNQHTFGHVDVAYLPLTTWQEIHSGAAAGEEVRPDAYTEASAIALQAADGQSIDLAAGDSAVGTSSKTLVESFGSSPGYTAETSTLMLIQVFLYAISALVVGAFFTVWTIQRRPELAVLRAMGGSTGYLLRDGLAQALIVLLASTLVGVAIGVGSGALLASTPMPFALEAPAIGLAFILLIGLGLIGAAFAIARIATVDPLKALGGQR